MFIFVFRIVYNGKRIVFFAKINVLESIRRHRRRTDGVWWLLTLSKLDRSRSAGNEVDPSGLAEQHVK